MARNEWFARRRLVMMTAAMGALLACSSSPGGIVVETDGAGGATGDGSSDARETGGTGAGGAAGAASDGAIDVLADAIDDRSGDGAVPPLCVFHTPPPPLPFMSQDDGGPDADSDSGMVDAGGMDATMDVLDASMPETGAPDVVADNGTVDITVSDGPIAEASTDTPGDRSGGGRDGTGPGDTGPAPSITVINSPFLGPYLADSAGRTLYTFGNDKPGDCNYEPVADCEADCLIAWPAFDAGKRSLAMGLDPAVFGSTLRTDKQGQITTYYGWPLYYYRSDTAGNMITGHGKSKTWHVATVIPNNMMIMRDKTNPRYIADGVGRTLYVYDQDTVGTATGDPLSGCTGSCLTEHPPFTTNRINAVSTLATTDLQLFVRSDNGRQQVAYKGAPLYLSSADMQSGDQKGIGMGWTVAAAP
jgi:predicted lipoprotein with Yx(FWY)xxD motif